jgi:hypothetical protein
VSEILAIALTGAALCSAPSPVTENQAHVIVTRPCGFAWREALAGATAAAAAIALAAGATELRHRASQARECP